MTKCSEDQNSKNKPIVSSKTADRPSLQDLLSQCDPKAPMLAKDFEWESMPLIGQEIL